MSKLREMRDIAIREVKGFVTAIDWADLSENFALRTRGFRYDRQGDVARRDYGTKHRYASYPADPPISMLDGTTLYDAISGSEYDIVAGLDSATYTHLCVNDSALAGAWDTGNWISLTLWYGAYIKTVGGTNVLTISFDVDGVYPGVISPVGAQTQIAADELNGYIVHNITKGEYAFVSDSTGSSTPSTFATVSLNKYVGAANLNWAAMDELKFYRNSATKTAYTGSLGATPHIRFVPVSDQSKMNVYLGSSASVPVTVNPVRIRRYNASRSFFTGAANAPTLGAGWRLHHGGGGLVADFQERGSSTAPVQEGWTAATGTVSSSGTTITGTTTAFFTEFKVGSYIRGNGTTVRRVEAITSNTNMLVDSDPSWSGGTTIEYSNGYDNLALIEDGNGYDWLQLGAHIDEVAPGSGTARHFVRLAIVAVYDSYQYSDVIYKLYAQGSGASQYPKISLSIGVNFELMPKNITSLRIYGETEDTTTYATMGDWADVYSDYIFLYEVNLIAASAEGRAWKGDLTFADDCLVYSYMFSPPEMTETWLSNKITAAVSTVLGDLGHAVDTARSYIKPRYGAKMRRTQKDVRVVDEGDRTLRLSAYNGDGNNQDDDFPDLSTDSAGNALKVFLASEGELYGLIFSGELLHALKRSEIELWDFQSNQQVIVQADVLAKRSFVVNEKGFYWCGDGGIYWMRKGSQHPELINDSWKNFYDGSLKIDNDTSATSYITNSYRKNAIGGYDSRYREVWFQIQANRDTADGGGSEYLSFRMQVDTGLWSVRKLNIGSAAPVKWFSKRTDDQTFTIGYASGILKYPNIESALPWQEEVTSADVTANKGFETMQILHIGSLYTIGNDFVIDEMLVDQQGESSTGIGQAKLSFYANRETSTFDTQYIDVDQEYPHRLGVKRRGPLDRLRIKMELETPANFKYWEIGHLVLSVGAKERVGMK